MNISNLTPQQLRKAADIQEKIVTLQEQLNEVLGGEVPTPIQALEEAPEKPKNGRRKKRGMSAAGRAALSAAVKARWAKFRAAKGEAKPAPKPQRKMTAAWRAALAASAKARWARVKAAGKTRL